MPLRCILIPIAPGIDATHRFDISLVLGKLMGAHVKVLFVSPDPTALFATLPDAVHSAGVTVEGLAGDYRQAAARAKSAFDDWCRGNDIRQGDPSDRLDALFATWETTVGDPESAIALAGRVTDVTIVDRPAIESLFSAQAFDAAVFSTGRPVLVLPDGKPADLLRHVVIAWNGSLEATRAVGQSMDLLHEAEQVSIIEIGSRDRKDRGFSDLKSYLRWHGIITHPLPIVHADDRSMGDAMLAETARHDATMLVMGAYTHSRIPHFLLGGVTRHVLDHSTIPVLMAH